MSKGRLTELTIDDLERRRGARGKPRCTSTLSTLDGDQPWQGFSAQWSIILAVHCKKMCFGMAATWKQSVAADDP